MEAEVPYFQRDTATFVQDAEDYRTIDSVVALTLTAHESEDKPLFTKEEKAKQSGWQKMLMPIVAPLLKKIIDHENKTPKDLIWLDEYLKTRSSV